MKIAQTVLIAIALSCTIRSAVDAQRLVPFVAPMVNISSIGRALRFGSAFGAGYGIEAGIRYSAFSFAAQISKAHNYDESNYSPFINPDGVSHYRYYTGDSRDGVSEVGGSVAVQPRPGVPLMIKVGGGYERKTGSPFVSGGFGFVKGRHMRLHVDAEFTRYAVYYEDGTIVQESGHVTSSTIDGYGTEWAKRNAVSVSVEIPLVRR